MSLDAVNIVNAATLEKIVLTQRVGRFLQDDKQEAERSAIENVARLLAQDISLQVREALAFELRTCKQLPHDLAAKIAADVESVSGPFLSSTEVFSDMQMAGMIPHLEEHAHIVIARRPDVGPQTSMAIVSAASDKSVSFLVRNDHVSLAEDVCHKMVSRFGMNREIMNLLAKRVDLPLSIVEAIISKVSDDYRQILVDQYGVAPPLATQITGNTQQDAIWKQISDASPAQIHGYVVDLKKAGRLTTDLVLDMAERGKLSFLESTIALEAGLTLGAVREALYGKDMSAFVRVMQAANVSKSIAGEYHKIVSKHKKQA